MPDNNATLPAAHDLGRFTRDLIHDLKALREKRITLAEARVRAQLAREVLRSVHLQLQGFRLLADSAKAIGNGEPPDSQP